MRVFCAALAAIAIIATLLALLTAPVDAVIGGDISQPFPEIAFRCARDKGWDFIIVRGYQSLGRVDPNAKGSLINAKNAGIPYRDTYCFPDARQAPQTSIRAVKDALHGHYGMVWLDVETGAGWSGDLAANCNWISHWLDEARAIGVHAGVYASEYMWGRVAGAGCRTGADHGAPLWYADYDARPSFAGFRPFGGWSKPSIKQYNDKTNVDCAINADANWYP